MTNSGHENKHYTLFYRIIHYNICKITTFNQVINFNTGVTVVLVENFAMINFLWFLNFKNFLHFNFAF